MNNKHTIFPSQIAFYAIWLGSLILQAIYTELIDDEAYYWYYAQHLDWGYFDHPPVIALLIKTGTGILGNTTLGVRIMSILLSGLTVFIWEKIIEPKLPVLYYLLVSSVAVLHFYGFVATPDAPLLFFSALALYFYKKFLSNNNWINAMGMGIALGLAFLSKYHAVLVAALVLLSNIKLLRNKYFWFTVFIIILIDFRHLLWQIHHHFPSLSYHFFERSAKPYSFSFTFEYLLFLPFVFGPFTGLFIFWSNFTEQKGGKFEKGLKFIFWGGLIFFFIMSFKGRNEPHWILFTLYPGLYFTYLFLEKNIRFKRYFYYSLPLSYIIILLARIFFIFEWEHPLLKPTSDYYHNKKWIQSIHQELGNLPVVFMNSYQKPSLYYFYTGVEAFSLNNIQGRKNQFNIWDWEDKYRGKTLAVIPNYIIPVDTIPGTNGRFRYVIINNFQSYSKLWLKPLNEWKDAYYPNEEIHVKLFVENRHSGTIDLEANKQFPVFIFYHYEQNGKVLPINKTGIRLTNKDIDSEIECTIKLPSNAGKYQLFFDVATGWFPPSYNSNKYNVKVFE